MIPQNLVSHTAVLITDNNNNTRLDTQ